MRRSAQLSLVHHFRHAHQGNVARVLDDQSAQAATTSSASAVDVQRTQWTRLGGRRGSTITRSYSTKNSPFATNNNLNDIEKKQKSPDFSNIPGARLPKSAPKTPTRVLEISKAQADEAFRTCLEMIRKHDVDSYLSILTMDKRAQPELVALNALNVELASIRDKVDTRRGDTSAMYRLQFWKDAISSIHGLSPLPVPRQPVAIALCVFAARSDHRMLMKLVESRQSTIGDRQFSDIEALSQYGRSTTGSLLSLQLDALARPSQTTVLPPAHDVALDLGAAYSIVNLLRATHPLLPRGIVLLPSDVMALHGATSDSVYKKKKLEETRGVVRDLTMESKRLLATCRERKEVVPRAVRPALASVSATTDWIIKCLEKTDFDVYSPQLQRRNPLIMWTLLVRKFLSKY